LKRSLHFVIRAIGSRRVNAGKSVVSAYLTAAEDGSHLAILRSMKTNAAVHRNTGIGSFLRGVRAFAEASLVALAFGVAIFLIGLPLALSVRVMRESFSWLARLGGEMGPLTDALVSVAAVAAGFVLTAAFARALIGVFRWRGALRRNSRAALPVGSSRERQRPALRSDSRLRCASRMASG